MMVNCRVGGYCWPGVDRSVNYDRQYLRHSSSFLLVSISGALWRSAITPLASIVSFALVLNLASSLWPRFFSLSSLSVSVSLFPSQSKKSIPSANFTRHFLPPLRSALPRTSSPCCSQLHFVGGGMSKRLDRLLAPFASLRFTTAESTASSH